ncbi:hypothetical protein CHUAL_008406 [Chamberlinius hualienensis]
MWTTNAYNSSNFKLLNQLDETLYLLPGIMATDKSIITVTYFINTTQPECAFVSIFYISNLSELTEKRFMMYNQCSSSPWYEISVDCAIDKCCESYDCVMMLAIVGSAGCTNGSGIIVVESVTGEIVDETRRKRNANGCS